jgi:hypothetical protein
VGSGLQDVESPQENRAPHMKISAAAVGRAAAARNIAM